MANPEVRLAAKELAESHPSVDTGYQAIFNLHGINGDSHVEIGKMMGIRVATAHPGPNTQEQD